MAIKNIQCEDIPKVPKSQKVILIAPDLQAVLAFLFKWLFWLEVINASEPWVDSARDGE